MNDDLPPWIRDGSQIGSQYGNNDNAPWNNDNSGYDHNFNNPGRAPWDIQPPLQICEDKHSDCAGKEMYCHGGNSNWMNRNCKKTCGKCLSGK